jgi:hypothetical protein
MVFNNFLSVFLLSLVPDQIFFFRGHVSKVFMHMRCRTLLSFYQFKIIPSFFVFLLVFVKGLGCGIEQTAVAGLLLLAAPLVRAWLCCFSFARLFANGILLRDLV